MNPHDDSKRDDRQMPGQSGGVPPTEGEARAKAQWPAITKQDMQTVLDHALRYAEMGWHVIPCDPRPGYQKKPLIKWGEGATIDAATVRRLFTRFPGSHIGVAAMKSGLVCIDQDNKNGKTGVEDFARLLGGNLGTECRSRSPSGGEHAIYTADSQFVVRSRVNALAPGIDVKAAGAEHGGYFIAPNGIDKRSWIGGPPWEKRPSPMPQVLLDLLKEREARGPARKAPDAVGPSAEKAVPSAATQADAVQAKRDLLREIYQVDKADPEQLARVQRALRFIPAEERDVWFSAILGAHAACSGSEDGIALVREFSNKASRRPAVRDPAGAERIYRDADVPQVASALGRNECVTDARLWALAYLCGCDQEVGAVTTHSLDAAASAHRHSLSADKIDVDQRLRVYEEWRIAEVRSVFAAVPLPADDGVAPAVGLHRTRGAGRIQLVTAAQLAARPRARDLWARMMPAGSLSVWYGAPKCGKSYLALGLGIAVAEGKPFLGRDTIVDRVEVEGSDGAKGIERRPRAGTVIYIAGEGINGIVDKMAAAIGPGRVTDGADPIHRRFFILPSMPALTEPGAMEAVLAEIKKLGVPADLIIVDTVARALGASGLDENSTEDMGRFVAALDHLREQTGAAVLGNHHAGKNGVDRGSSALRGAADVFAKVSRVASQVSRLTVEDMRDGEPGAPIDVTFGQSIVGDDEHGHVVRWRIISYATAGAFDGDAGVDTKGDAEVLEAVCRSPQPCKRGDLQEETGMSRSTILKALKRLRSAGSIEQLGHGKKATYVASSPVSAPGADAETKRRTVRLVSSPDCKKGDESRTRKRNTNKRGELG